MVGKAFSGVKAGNSAQGAVTVDIIPLPIILAGQFEALAFSVRSFREPLKRAVQFVVIPSIKKNFASEGRPAWTELAEGTIYNRQYEGFDAGPILQRSGKGRNAALAMARWVFTTDTAIMGGAFPSSAKYMPIHQIASTGDMFTGSLGTAFLPGRPFALIQEEDMPKIEAVFGRWFSERAAKVGIPTL